MSSSRKAWAHLWLGEKELTDRQPERAIRHFDAAMRLASRKDRSYGLAAFDAAAALYFAGAYRSSEEAFARLLKPKTALRGYDRRTCALWLKHASACAGYHNERREMGIPEPPRLDPLCGAAALATCLRGIGEPYGKDRVLPSIKRTGLGSTMQDIVDAAGKLGVKAAAVTADDKGLIALPKPLVAFVEHDHFIAVTGADNKGVDYLCSDCGAWPGGKVHLSWKQWHKLEATIYTAVYKPGSPLDQVLTRIASEKPGTKPGVRLASTAIPAAMQGALSQATLKNAGVEIIENKLTRPTPLYH